MGICTQGTTYVWNNNLGEMARFYRASYSTQHMRQLQEVERGDLFWTIIIFELFCFLLLEFFRESYSFLQQFSLWNCHVWLEILPYVANAEHWFRWDQSTQSKKAHCPTVIIISWLCWRVFWIYWMCC